MLCAHIKIMHKCISSAARMELMCSCVTNVTGAARLLLLFEPRLRSDWVGNVVSYAQTWWAWCVYILMSIRQSMRMGWKRIKFNEMNRTHKKKTPHISPREHSSRNSHPPLSLSLFPRYRARWIKPQNETYIAQAECRQQRGNNCGMEWKRFL